MRSLSTAKTMRLSGLAAGGSAIFSLPRLFQWENRPADLWLLVLIIGCAAFFLWSFVFAWHTKETGRRVLAVEIGWQPWVLATVVAMCAALLLRVLVDPISQQFNLEFPPKDLSSWAANTLFTLGFEQLFVCFAPFAYFIRLAHRTDVAAVLTVLLGALILSLKLSAADQFLPTAPVLLLVFARVLLNSLSVFFYLRGGVLLAWWWVLLLQARHLIGLVSG